MPLIVDDRYTHLRRQLLDMPLFFTEERGQLLQDARNQIRLVDIDGHPIVVKRFRKRDFIGQLKHTLFRKHKARRAYENSQELIRRGVHTPYPIAYLEERQWGIIKQVYYACEYTDAQAVSTWLTDRKEFDREFAKAYASFVAALHEKGVMHRDLNPLNTLYAEHYFQLIDVNRMRFFDGLVPKRKCMEEWCLFWWMSDVWMYLIREYASIRHWTEDDISLAIELKQQHDENWIKTGKYNKTIFGEMQYPPKTTI